ncbi:MAG: AtpZ/AtpI family protein [bacterium]|nr:AtpZ/AtpI family protein [bacterium]
MSQKKKPDDKTNESEEVHSDWWSNDALDDTPLPDNFPTRPDGEKVRKLRQKMRKERQDRANPKNRPRIAKFANRVGQSASDIGTYTLIPMMMLAGPAVGYGLGWLAEKQWGGEPWTSTTGVLVGLAAAFRQIIILLNKKSRS